ncbi:MAG: hypothetical protein LBU34_08140 [Planctomycetaceae bacterium]|jgi:hypothetical protein|nr:hypothetical protein [Planctomycetaceae bacterium]
MKTFFMLICSIMVLVTFSGCKKEPKTLGVVPASGTVTLDGEVIEGASITFVPKPGTSGGQGVSAISDKNGHFSLGILQSGEGAIPGIYWVSVIKITDITPFTPEERVKLSDAGRPVKPVYRYEIPQKYENPKSSGIEIEIPDIGNQNIRLELKK